MCRVFSFLSLSLFPSFPVVHLRLPRPVPLLSSGLSSVLRFSLISFLGFSSANLLLFAFWDFGLVFFALPARRVCTSLNNFSSSATLFFHHATFWRQILHLQLHFIYLISNFKPRSPFYTRPCVFKMTDTLRPAEVFFRVVACRRLHARIL